VRAARVAASDTGAKVGLAEESRYGGTCVIRGCVPKKLMVFASTYAPAMEQAAAYGWDVQMGGFNWSGFRRNLEGELDRLEGIYRRLLQNSGVETFDMRATVDGPHSVRLADGRVVTAKVILLATGGWPSVPDVPGAEYAITSKAAILLVNLPAFSMVLGCKPIFGIAARRSCAALTKRPGM